MPKLAGLYAITDEHLITEKDFNTAIEAALQGGARIIQYRDKSPDQKKRFQQSSALRALCQDYQALCIINDDIELALAVNADGVHLGKDDTALAQARCALGDDAIIGVSCYNDLSLALAAEKNTASYVAFGAIFASPTKPHAPCAGLDIIKQARQQLSIPICGIGGITEKNIQQVIHNGCEMTAIISGIFASKDIKNSARHLAEQFS